MSPIFENGFLQGKRSDRGGKNVMREGGGGGEEKQTEVQ